MAAHSAARLFGITAPGNANGSAALADLKSCGFARFTDNFVRFNATPGNLDWADDAGWTVLAEKAGHFAWLMKQAGAKAWQLIRVLRCAQSSSMPSKAACSRTPRPGPERGGQFVQAVGHEFPDAVVLTLWMNRSI